MTNKTIKKIGFFSALSICFTSVVGIGVFLRNSSVGNNTEGNGISWLITWIIAGIIAILLAYHFGKISKVESKKQISGINGWTNEIADYKNNWFKKIVSTNYGLFYNPILALCLSFFCSEFFILFLQTIDENIHVDIWCYVLITFCFVLFFILNNYFSYRFSSYISLTTSILKFIPLLAVIFIGLIFANSHNISENTTSNGFNQNISIDKAVQGIMLSIPSVLFCFDSFVGVGAWSKEIKGGQKAVSKVIVTSMILVTIVYSLVCIASIFHYNNGQGGTTILNVLIDSLPVSSKKAITIIVSLFIFISAFGTSNSVCGTTINEFKNIIISKNVILSNYLSKIYGKEKGSLIMCFIVMSFWFLVIFIPTIIINTDAVVDGFSNLVVVLIFLIYTYLVYLYWKSKNWKKKDINYSIVVWITIVGVIVVLALNIYYVFYNGIVEHSKMSSWGLFLSGTEKFKHLNNLDVLIFYVSFMIVFFAFPFLSYSIVTKKRKIIN